MNEILERLQSLVGTVFRQVENHGELNRRFGEEVLPGRVGDLLDKALAEIHETHKFESRIDNRVTHYTGVQTVEALLRGIAYGKSASLRLNNSGDFNDPNEGEFFTQNLRLPQEHRWILRGNPSHAYVASFITPDRHNDFSDDLRYWRPYGKDGAGCSLVLNIPPDRLRKVLYGIPHVRRVRQTLVPFLDVLRPLSFYPNVPLRDSIRGHLSTGVWSALAGIKYLYKDDAYCYERECRVVVPEAGLPREEIIFQLDEKEGSLPGPKHYIDDSDLNAERILSTGSRIILGPCVDRRENLRFYFETLKRLKRGAGSDPEVTLSPLRYRGTG